MKLTIEHYDSKVEITVDHDDVDIYEVADLLRRLLTGAGFAESSIKEIIPEVE